MEINAESLTRSHLESLTDEQRRSLLAEISHFLSKRILKTSDFEQEVKTVIGELRLLGHDLWLYDTDGEWQTWCGDYTKPQNSGKLILEFTPSKGVEAMWSEAK